MHPLLPMRTIRSPEVPPMSGPSSSSAYEDAIGLAGAADTSMGNLTSRTRASMGAYSDAPSTTLQWPATGRVVSSPVKMGSQVVDLPAPDIYAHVHRAGSGDSRASDGTGTGSACSACVELAKSQYVELRASLTRSQAGHTHSHAHGNTATPRMTISRTSRDSSASAPTRRNAKGTGAAGDPNATAGASSSKPIYVLGTSARATSNARIRAQQQEHDKKMASLALKARQSSSRVVTVIPTTGSGSSGSMLSGGGGLTGTGMGSVLGDPDGVRTSRSSAAFPPHASTGSSTAAFRMTVSELAGSPEARDFSSTLTGAPAEIVTVAPSRNPLNLPVASAERAAARFAAAADVAARSLAAEGRLGGTMRSPARAASMHVPTGMSIPAQDPRVPPLPLQRAASMPAQATLYGPQAGLGVGAGGGGVGARTSALSQMRQRMDAIMSNIDTSLSRMGPPGTTGMRR